MGPGAAVGVYETAEAELPNMVRPSLDRAEPGKGIAEVGTTLSREIQLA